MAVEAKPEYMSIWVSVIEYVSRCFIKPTIPYI
jgi:hypothetical protein